MGVLGDASRRFIRAVTGAAPVWDCFVNSNAATTTFGATTTVALGTTAANKRRILFAFSVSDWHLSAEIRIPANAGTVGNIVALPVVNQLALLGDGSDISWTNADQSAGTAWIEANVNTTGPGTDPGGNTDNNYRAVLPFPAGSGAPHVLSDVVGGGNINPTSGSLHSVFARAAEAAIEQGTSYGVIMLVKEDESAAGATLCNLLGAATTPLLGAGTGVPILYNTVLECPARLALTTDTTFCVVVQLGTIAFSVGDLMRIRFNVPTGDIVDGNESVDYEFDGTEVAGQWIKFLDIEPDTYADSNGFFQYQVLYESVNGTSPIIAGPTHIGRLMGGPSQSIWDNHWMSAINDAKPADWVANTVYAQGDFIVPTTPNGYKYICTTGGTSHATVEPTWPTTMGNSVVDNGTLAWQIYSRVGAGTDFTDVGSEALLVQAASFLKYENMCDGTAENHPSFAIDGGDNLFFVLMSSLNPLFPVHHDGSGIANSPTSIEATDEDDVHESGRAWFKWNAFPYWSVSILWTMNNHSAGFWFNFFANNGGETSIADWVTAAAIDACVIPPNSAHSFYSQPTTARGQANYSWVNKNTQCYVLNVYRGSGSNKDITPWAGPYVTVGIDDWAMTVDDLAWVASVTAASTCTSADVYRHNGMTRYNTGAPTYYGRGDIFKLYLTASDLALRNTFETKWPGLWEDNYGHDHLEDYGTVGDGRTTARCHATQGNVPFNATSQPPGDGTYDGGFYNDIGNPISPGLHARPGTNRLHNAGCYFKFYNEHGFFEDYIATLVSTAVAGVEYLDNSDLAAAGYVDGQLIRRLTFPASHSPRIINNSPIGNRITAQRPYYQRPATQGR